MTDDQDRTRATNDSRKLVGRKDISDYTGGWGVPAFIAAVVFIGGILVFSAAGPDRTRTAEYDSARPASGQQSPTGAARGSGAKIPNADMPTAPR
jgi:hypothetical protein